jgi:NAD(P)-dependent dehydrogenase (short-subunit alcohol dehydrogenase family)
VAVTNAMLPLLRRAPAARIVNVSSEVGSIASTLRRDSPLWRMTGLAYPSSKTAVNMITALYAKELWDTPIKVNAANPGYCATDLNGNSGFRTPAQGASVSVHLATLPADGPSGQLWGDRTFSDGESADGVLPW